ncbi:MAG: glycosyltransferase [Desulfuromonadales bacterium]|nr:glycosyltransferase [Desulfuromonadales bacterium]
MRFYLSVKIKLVLALGLALGWLAFSLWVGWPWLQDLSDRFTTPVAWLIIAGLALLPGWANAFLICGLVVDRRPRYPIHRSLPPVSILIAAYNEEECIGETIDSILQQKYQGEVEVLVIDDGSRDATAWVVGEKLAKGRKSNFQLRLLSLEHNCGKAAALNAGLAQARHQILVTVDADTFMYDDALARIVANLIDGPANTAAVAGTVLVRNSRETVLARLQEWDYFLGIAVVKRIQSLFQGTLVAQGAFSAYRREAVERAGGWAHTVGEDIVLTWGFHDLNYRVGYAENAFVFTRVPESYRQFFRQRQRWARGLIEAIKKHPRLFLRWKMITPFLFLNLLFPYLDAVFLLVFVPGLVAAVFFQYYAVVGLMTLLILPLTLVVNLLMFFRQRRIFLHHGLRVRKNLFGLALYILTYQLLMSPASLAGYVSEFLNLRKSWGTKAAQTTTVLLLCLLPLLAGSAWGAAPNRLLAEYEFFSDSDHEEHHGFYAGYQRRLSTPWPALARVRTGVLQIRNSEGKERFEVLRGSYDAELDERVRLQLQGTYLSGDDWSPFLYGGALVWTPPGRWRIELSGERSIIDSVAGIRQRLTVDTAAISADFALSEQITLVGALFHQGIDDGNDRLGKVARLIWSPQRVEGLHLQLYGKRIDSDFDGTGYFSPQTLEELFLLAGISRPFANEQWVARLQAGPGLQWIDGRRQGAFRSEFSLRGWFTPSLGLEGKLAYAHAQESREAYDSFLGGISLVYAW